jgi:hypothetical protein
MTHESDRRREPPDASVGRLFAALAGTATALLISLAALYVFYRVKASNASLIPPRDFPAPELETDSDGAPNPAVARQKARLRAYAWIDRERGLVQIPIMRAMSIVAARGSRAYDPVPSPPGGTPP